MMMAVIEPEPGFAVEAGGARILGGIVGEVANDEPEHELSFDDLIFSSSPITPRAFVTPPVMQFMSPTHLDLSNASLGPRMLMLANVLGKEFRSGRMQGMLSLNLRNNGAGPSGAIAIAGALIESSNITSFDFSHNGAEESGVCALINALAISPSPLRHLDLQVNRAGPAGARAAAVLLETSTHLVSLNMSLNRIGAKGAVAIARSLRRNSTLETLQVSHNNMRDKGALSFADALRCNRTLTSLNLRCNAFSGVCTAILHEMANQRNGDGDGHCLNILLSDHSLSIPNASRESVALSFEVCRRRLGSSLALHVIQRYLCDEVHHQR